VLRDDVTATELCAAAYPVALCALQGPLQGSWPLPSWRELTRLARCTRGANWTVMMHSARQTPRYPSSSADSFPLLLRARDAESARSPGEKAATV